VGFPISSIEWGITQYKYQSSTVTIDTNQVMEFVLATFWSQCYDLAQPIPVAMSQHRLMQSASSQFAQGFLVLVLFNLYPGLGYFNPLLDKCEWKQEAEMTSLLSQVIGVRSSHCCIDVNTRWMCYLTPQRAWVVGEILGLSGIRITDIYRVGRVHGVFFGSKPVTLTGLAQDVQDKTLFPQAATTVSAETFATALTGLMVHHSADITNPVLARIIGRGMQWFHGTRRSVVASLCDSSWQANPVRLVDAETKVKKGAAPL
jgi:hypothetical protein